MKKLENKKILFIAPAFFGYEEKITEKMVELGAYVDFFDERSVKSSYEKALLKINPRIFHKKTITYYNQIFNKVSNIDYDHVFIIKCEMIPVEVIKKLKNLFSHATFTLYLYDSLDNIKGINMKLKYFDRVLSFDMEDANRHSQIMFRPLFFIDDYKVAYNKQKEYKYDVSFIGTIHSDRFKIIKTIKDIAERNKYKYFLYCYLQSKFIYYFYKLSKKEFYVAKKKDFSFNKISSVEIADIIDKTKVVIDVQHPKQTGLTMRTIEMIGMHKKLITTNQSIKEYDFYNPSNIAVIDRINIKISKEFLDSPYKKIDDVKYMNYSIENWIIEVLGE